MPGLTIPEDGSIGTALADAFKNAGEGPKLAIAAQQAAAEIAYKNAQRKQLESQIYAADQYNTANRQYWNAQQAPDAGSPNQVAWAGAGGPIGSETVPAAGPAPLTPLTPDITAKDQTLQSNVTGNFNRMRDLNLAGAQLGATHTTSFEDAAKGGPKYFGQTQLGLSGMPTTPDATRVLGAQLKGELEKPDNKVQGNWIEMDKNGLPVPGTGGLLTADGLDAKTGRDPNLLMTTPGGRPAKSQEAHISGAGIFDSPGTEKNALFRLAQKANSPTGLDPNEEAQLKYVARFVFPWAQTVEKNPQGQYVLMSHQANEPPQLLSDALAKVEGGPAAAAAPAAAPGTAFTQGAAPLAAPGAAPPSGVPDTSRFATPGIGAPGAPGAGPQAAAPGAPQQPPPAVSGLKMGAPVGAGESSGESARKDATAVLLANNALQEFYKRFNYSPKTVDAQGNVTPGQFIDPKTGQPNMSPGAVTNVVPNLRAGIVAEKLGTGLIGQGISNYLDPKSQDYNAISYRFVEPVIRMASGAAINPSEYSQYFNMFIPNANDSPKTAAAKLDAMRDWVAAVSTTSTARGALDAVMKSSANNPLAMQAARVFGERANVKGTLDTPFSQLPGGGQAQGAPAAAATATAAPAGGRVPPKIGDVVMGRAYRGGDPSKPAAWQ